MVVLLVGLQGARVPLQVRRNSIGPLCSLRAEEVDHCGALPQCFYNFNYVSLPKLSKYSPRPQNLLIFIGNILGYRHQKSIQTFIFLDNRILISVKLVYRGSN